MKMCSKSFIWNRCTRRVDVWKKIWHHASKWRLFKRTVTKRQRPYRTQYGKDPHPDNAIRRWLKQFQEPGSVVAAIITVTRQMLANTWTEIKYRLDILRATKVTHVEDVQHSTVLIL
jgi:hypothetical protein